jgi:hypothetical protein
MITLRAHQHHDVDAHSPFGGSVAARVLHCPASVSLVEKVPAHLRKASANADRGTALHAATARLIERECSLDDLVGETIGGYTLTRDDIENALRPALVYVEALLDQPGAEYYLEHRVVFPTIPGAFGTLDLLVRIVNTIYVMDFKFGSGVLVRALYADGAEDIINAQLCLRCRATRFHILHRGRRHRPDDYSADVDRRRRRDGFPSRDAYRTQRAFVALSRPVRKHFHPRRAWSGEHCRFCPAGLSPGAHQSAARSGAIRKPDALRAALEQAYLQVLADGKPVGAIKDVGKALHDQAGGLYTPAIPCPAMCPRKGAPYATGTTRATRSLR